MILFNLSGGNCKPTMEGSSTHIAYIYRSKVFCHRFSYTDPTRYIPIEEVKKILKKLRLMIECGETHKINIECKI